MHNEYGVSKEVYEDWLSKEVFRDMVRSLKWYAGKPLSPRFKIIGFSGKIAQPKTQQLDPNARPLYAKPYKKI